MRVNFFVNKEKEHNKTIPLGKKLVQKRGAKKLVQKRVEYICAILASIHTFKFRKHSNLANRINKFCKT